MFVVKKFFYSGFNSIVLRNLCHFLEVDINISTMYNKRKFFSIHKHKQPLNQ